MPSWSMRPNDSARPPGVQASCPATDVVGADQHHRAERERGRRRARSRQPRRSRKHHHASAAAASSARMTAKVALWVATANAISAIERVALPAAQRAVGEDQKMHRQHGEAGEDVGQQDAGEPRQRGEDGQRRGDAEQQRAAGRRSRARAAPAPAPRPSARPGATTTGQKSGCAKMLRNSPNTVERLGTR